MSGAVFGEQMLGRDAFYALLAREGLKLKRPKPRHTTNSNHRFHKWKNLALNTLIDIAESQGIQIRKKSGAKQ